MILRRPSVARPLQLRPSIGRRAILGTGYPVLRFQAHLSVRGSRCMIGSGADLPHEHEAYLVAAGARPPIRGKPFSTRIREATRDDHERTERSPFVARLPGWPGDVAADMPRMTGQLWFMYEALETAALRLRDDPVAGPFLDPRLSRRAALEADLTELIGRRLA